MNLSSTFPGAVSGISLQKIKIYSLVSELVESPKVAVKMSNL